MQEFKMFGPQDLDILLNDDFINKIIDSKYKILEIEKSLKEANEAKLFLS